MRTLRRVVCSTCGQDTAPAQVSPGRVDYVCRSCDPAGGPTCSTCETPLDPDDRCNSCPLPAASVSAAPNGPQKAPGGRLAGRDEAEEGSDTGETSEPAATQMAAGDGPEDVEVSTDRRDYAVVQTVSRVAAEHVQWIWYGRIPAGMLSVLDGDPSVGKSTLTLDFAARVSTGTPWPDGTPCPLGDVLLLSAEDSLAATIRPRLEAAGADLDRVHVLVEVALEDEEGRVRRVPPSLPRDLGRVEDFVRRHQVKLVVVDVLMAYLDGRVDSHRDQDVRGVLHEMAAMAHRTGAAILLVRHLNKAGGASPLYRGGGSIGIIGAARAGLLAAADPEDESGARRILAVSKSNLAPMPPALSYRLLDASEHGCARVAWEDGPTAHRAADLLRYTDDSGERGERNEAATWLTDYLTDQGGEASAVAVYRAGAAEGYSKYILKRVKERAGAESVKGGMHAGWVWRLRAETTGSDQAGPQAMVTQGDNGSREGGKGASRREREEREERSSLDPAPFAPFVLPSGPTCSNVDSASVTDGGGPALVQSPAAVSPNGPGGVENAPACEVCGGPVGPLRAHAGYPTCARCYLAATEPGAATRHPVTGETNTGPGVG